MRYFAYAVVFLGFFQTVWADSITYGGKTFDGVYIRESGTMFYVQNPQDGSVASVAKSEVQTVALSQDENARKALLERWKKANEALRGAPVTGETASGVSSTPSTPSATGAAERVAEAESGSGPVSVRMKNVPLKDALKATLRSQGLDYSVEGNYIRVATPEKLRREPFEGLQGKALSVNNQGDTLPKVVVRNPGGGWQAQQQQGIYGGGSGMYGGRGGGVNGLYSGGMMSGGYQYGGMTGNYGGMGGTGYMGGGQTFSNISDLFSTIDDRLVGETPAVIGTFGY